MEATHPSRPAADAPAIARIRDLLGSTWTLGALVFVLTWGGGATAPVPFSLDISSHTGLNMAVVDGLDFGGDLAFTYGPLGFLKTYLVLYEWPARLAALYGILLHAAISLTLVYAARRSFALPLALAIALVAAVLMRGDMSQVAVRSDASVVVLALIWSVASLQPSAPVWIRRVVLFGGGAFAAIEILAKLNTGILVLALVTAAVLAMDGERKRNLATAGATFVATAAALWFATGHGIGDISAFVRWSFEVAAGYSSGARLEYGTRGYDYVLAGAAAVIVLGIALLATAGLPRARRIISVAMVALVAFTAFKGGFVSHEVFHMASFYATMLGACLAFVLPQRRLVRAGGVAGLGVIAVGGFTTHFEGYPMVDPVDNLRNGASAVVSYLEPGELGEQIAESRAELRAAYALDDESLALLEGHSVHVDPGETAAAWAYELDWQPLPIYQPYVAWTPDLDQRNADELSSAEGPERILRQATNPLGRYPGFDPPASMVAMLCNFEPLRTTVTWQVLGRIPNRCAPERPLSRVEGAYGEAITVPQVDDDELLIGRVEGIGVAGSERLEALLHRANARQVFLDASAPYVFLPQTAEDGLLMRAPAGDDFPGPFALAADADQITFLLDGEPPDDPLAIEFSTRELNP